MSQNPRNGTFPTYDEFAVQADQLGDSFVSFSPYLTHSEC